MSQSKTPLLDSQSMDGRRPEDRTALMNAVQQLWLDGVLQPAVEPVRGRPLPQPAVTLLTEPARPTIDPDLRPIFDQSGRQLLILGRVGAGKTVALLKLADSLLDTARRDAAAPVPVVLNLSSWNMGDDLLLWLAEALFATYEMSRDLAREWVTAGRLILLLDGLDEVDAAQRADCLHTINYFQAEHRLPLVVCSRTADDDSLSPELDVETAVVIAPLEPGRADNFLAELGHIATELRRTVKQSEPLQELATSPLMLRLMAMTYAGSNSDRDPAELQAVETVDEAREQVLTAYVDQALAHPPEEKADALRRLGYLAQTLTAHRPPFFRLEALGPSWLPTRRARRRTRHFLAMELGLYMSLLFSVLSGLMTMPMLGGLFVVLTGTIVSVILMQVDLKVSTDRVRWLIPPPRGWGAVIRRTMFFMALLVGGPLIVLGGLMVINGDDWEPFLTLPFALMLFWATLMALFLGIPNELTTIDSTFNNRPYPNQDLLRPHMSELMVGVLIGSPTLIVVELIQGPVWMAVSAVLFLSFFGLSSPIRNGLIHYTVRAQLARRNLLPFPFSGWRDPDRELIDYLDEMVGRGLLYRVGPGWMFRHRLLRDHLADRLPVRWESLEA